MQPRATGQAHVAKGSKHTYPEHVLCIHGRSPIQQESCYTDKAALRCLATKRKLDLKPASPLQRVDLSIHSVGRWPGVFQ